MNDKKKLAVMAALVVVVFGVGAFQFVNMSGEAPKPAAETAKKEKPEENSETTEPEATTSTAMQNLYAVGMNPRDPFMTGQLDPVAGTQPPAVTPPPANPAPRPSGRRPGNGFRPPRNEFGGEIPPWNAGQLPNVRPTGQGGGPTLPPAGTPVDEFGFNVTGVITGSKPAAVFTDANGNQRLVTVGGSLDGDSQLVSVERGRVVVKHKGKTKTFSVGGTPNAK